MEKTLPFGASISCSHFQRFSNCLRHIFKYVTRMTNRTSNYLDDYIFLGESEEEANQLVRRFIELCNKIGFPVSLEKTEWAAKRIIFLGLMLDGENRVVCIPEDKRLKVLNLVRWISAKKKATVKQLQHLAGLLNFLHRAIYPGRTFTRHMYAKFTFIDDHSGKKKIKDTKVKQYHNVRLDQEFKDDCKVWQAFLSKPEFRRVCRPFVDWDRFEMSEELNFTSDASAAENLGFGCVFAKRWCFGQWEPNFIRENKPSIEFLELYGLCVTVFTWIHLLRDRRIVIFCDNLTIVNVVNNASSSCRRCMYLIRMLT